VWELFSEMGVVAGGENKMSFKFLGVAPPLGSSVVLGAEHPAERQGLYTRIDRMEHFRGALQEAAEETQRLKRELPNTPLKDRTPEFFWWCDRMDELFTKLRVSAGEGK